MSAQVTGRPPRSAARHAVPPPLEAVRVHPALGVVRDLAAGLDRAGVRYCQFKSNQHLLEGVGGLTDLDVLVDRAGESALARVLASAGYKRFSAPPGGDYPAVEDYLGLDAATGRLVHLHLHHQLTTGERHLKGYRLPWEELVLATSRRDEVTGFRVADPDVEMLFLLTRNALKVRVVDRLRRGMGADLEREFTWLKERVRPERVAELGASLLGAPAGRALERLVTAGPTPGRLSALRASARTALDGCRTYLPAGAALQRWRRELELLHGVFARRFRRSAGPVSRTDPRGGVLVAFVGPDGAGKSRLVGEIAWWLRWKLDARVVYFGSGDGPSSAARRPLKAGLDLARALGLRRAPARVASGGADDDGAGAPRTRRPLPEELLRAVWALVLAHEKRQNLERAWRARNRGIVVVCDRYPQDQVTGFNDGPLLDHWRGSGSRLLRALARWESAPYRRAMANPPELVIKLHVSVPVARLRKPGMDEDELQRRRAALVRLRFPAATRVVDVDADRPWEAVLLECKQEVWRSL